MKKTLFLLIFLLIFLFSSLQTESIQVCSGTSEMLIYCVEECSLAQNCAGPGENCGCCYSFGGTCFQTACGDLSVAVCTSCTGCALTTPGLAYSLNSTNSSIAGTPVEHRLRWTHGTALSGYIFSFDNCTGSFSNDTWTSFRTTNQYNRSEDSITTGTYSAGAVNNLNVLGEGSSYDVQEAASGSINTTTQFSQSVTKNITGSNSTAPSNLDVQDSLSYNVTEAASGGTASTSLTNVTPTTTLTWTTGQTATACVAATLDSSNNVYCATIDDIDALQEGWINTTHSSSIPSDATITNVTICAEFGLTSKAGDVSGDGPGQVNVGVNDTGAWVYTTLGSCSGTGCAAWDTEAIRCYDATSTVTTVAKASHVGISVYYKESDDPNQDISTPDWFYVNVTYTRPNYKAEIEHNATISYGGTMQSINISVNFTTNVTSIFNLTIYNFTDGKWYSCNSGTATLNTWYIWWCNMTTNPLSYNSSANVTRVNLNVTTAHQNVALVREDYVQYYISNSSPTYGAEVYHNSSAVSYTGTLASVDATINFTTTATDTYYFDIYNWQSSSWANCQSGSVTANAWTKWWCNITTSPTNYNSSDNKIKVRINSTADTDQGTLQEDYIQYYINYFPNESWSNVTKIINSTSGCTIQWKVFANDTLNGWNTSSTYSYITTLPKQLVDQIVAPCSNSSTTNDYCNAETNPAINSAFNVTFRYLNSSNSTGTLNQTLRLRYASSTNPTTEQATTDVPYTEDCTGQNVILKNVYRQCGSVTCVDEGDGDVRIDQTTTMSNFDANISYEIQFCTGTAGKTYDISNSVAVSSFGTVVNDSFIQITPAVFEIWNYTTGNEIQSSPALGNLNGDSYVDVVIGSNDYKIYAFSGNNGTQLWNYSTTGAIYNAPILVTNLTGSDVDVDAVFGSYDGSVYALNGTNGNKLWSNTTGGGIGSSPTVIDLNGDSIKDVVVGSIDNKVYAFRGNNGTQLWNFSTSGVVWASPVATNLTAGGTVYVFVGSQDGYFYALNGTNGSQIWSYKTDGMVESSAAVDTSTKTVVFGSYDKKLYALNATNGSGIWNYTTPTAIISSPLITDVDNDSVSNVVFGSGGKIYVLNLTNNASIWNYTIPTGGVADSSPAVTDVNGDTYNDVIFGSSDNYVYVLSGKDGSFVWKHNIGGSVWGSPAIDNIDGVAGYEIIVGSSGKKVNVIDPPSSWGGNPQRTRILDDIPPENTLLQISNTTIDPSQPITIQSTWRDSASNLAHASLIENSSGSMVSYDFNLYNPSGSVDYTFLGLQDNQIVGFTILVSDAYGNTNTVKQNFVVKLTRQVICGDSICDYGEGISCPEDCPKGKESEGEKTEQPLPSPTIQPIQDVIQDAMRNLAEKLPQATKSLAPLIIAVVLVAVIIYVFVI